MNKEDIKCSHCGNIIPPDSNFCNKCGKELLPQERIPEKLGFSYKYFIISSLIVFLAMIITSFVAAIFLGIYDSNMDIIPENFIIVSSVGPAAGILISTIAITFFIKYIKIKEALYGAFFTIFLLKCGDFIIINYITFESILITLLYCLIAIFGIYAGNFFKKQFRFS